MTDQTAIDDLFSRSSENRVRNVIDHASTHPTVFIGTGDQFHGHDCLFSIGVFRKTMIHSASDRIVNAFRRFLSTESVELDVRIQIGEEKFAVPSFRVGARRLILMEGQPGVDQTSILKRLIERQDWIPEEEKDLKEVVVAIAGRMAAGAKEQVLGRGLSAIPLQRAVADVVGLPVGWLDAQRSLIGQILEPLRVGSEYRIARLRVRAENGESEEDAFNWLDRSLGKAVAAGHLIYLRAEAGKGKSTTFAELANFHLGQNDGPVPLLIPLRNLRRGAGASWEAIAGSVGVVGEAADELARAVKSGLVILLLDGLDEVSGRYDPGVIQEIVQAVSDQATGNASLLAFSGRTTEGMLLDPRNTYQRTIELPDIEGEEFRRYVEGVVDAVVPVWPILAPQVGEPVASDEVLTNREFSLSDRDHLIHWVLHNFADFGKDRSLFFVQSLACLARDMQLRGNKPIYVKQAGAAPKVILCSLYEACLTAASLACVREQRKVVQESQTLFTPARQLNVATWLAVLASADDTTRSGFPTPNELIAETFDLDPANQAEDLIAILRQMQKHALLYASGGLAGGDWRPGFLSDWVRSALLVRCWINRAVMSTVSPDTLTKAVATAQRARNAYHYIFPDRIARESDIDLADLVAALVSEANAGFPEACGNFWFLMQGLPDDTRAEVELRPERLVEWTDFSEFEFEGFDIGPEFSANLTIFARTQFIGCRFKGCQFTSCDFTEASFVNCAFEEVRFEHCDGPVYFEDCDGIRNTRFADVKTRQLPAWAFTHCHFETGGQVEQVNVPSYEGYGPIAAFDDCTCDEDAAAVLVGPELGQHRRLFSGLRTRTTSTATDPAVECLRQLLRPFFPSRVGAAGTHQARDYIRSSALGRGVFPVGSPSPTELTAFLNVEGFVKGGRQGHLYAPWSEVAGATRVELRSEFSGFLRNQASRGHTIQALLDKIRNSAGWS